jgi:hypothetical protein
MLAKSLKEEREIKEDFLSKKIYSENLREKIEKEEIDLTEIFSLKEFLSLNLDNSIKLSFFSYLLERLYYPYIDWIIKWFNQENDKFFLSSLIQEIKKNEEAKKIFFDYFCKKFFVYKKMLDLSEFFLEDEFINKIIYDNKIKNKKDLLKILALNDKGRKILEEKFYKIQETENKIFNSIKLEIITLITQVLND